MSLTQRTRTPILLACMVIVASVPFASGQDDNADAGDPQTIEFEAGHAEGRFVAFDVDADAGAVCDWSFEGQTVIEAMTGVSGNARAEGRVVMMDGGSAASEGACAVAADADVGSDGGGDGTSTGDDGDSTTTAASSPTDDEMDDQDGLDDEDDDASGTTTSDQQSSSDDSSDDDSTTTRTASTSARVAAAKVKLHDNPRGAIAIDLDAGQTVRLDLASGLEVRTDDNKVRVDGDGLSASLFLTKGSGDVEVRVEGSTIELDAAAPAKVHFRVADHDLERDEREEVDDHVGGGDVACEVFVTDDDEPDVVVIDDTNVTIRSTHTAVSVDIDIDLDVDIDVGSGGTDEAQGTTTQGPTTTRSATQTTTRAQTTTGGGGGGDDADDADDEARDAGNGPGCGCAYKVVILDVDVTVFVLEADDDLLVSLDGVLLARADSVQDALTIEAGEDPEALVVVDQDDEVKVITSLASGSSRLSLQAQGGEEFETREPVRVTRTTTLAYDGDDFADDRAADPEASTEGASEDGVPGFGVGVAVLALAAVTLLATRRRLE